MAQQTSPDMIEIPDTVDYVAVEQWSEGEQDCGIIWDRTGRDENDGEWGEELLRWEGDRADVVNRLEGTYGFTLCPWMPIPLGGLDEHMCEGTRERPTETFTLGGDRLEDFGAALRRHRLEVAKLSEEEVSDRMGLPLSEVARIEAGDDQITLSKLSRYALAVGIRLQFTVTEKEA